MKSLPPGSSSMEVMLVLSKMWEELPPKKQYNYVKMYARRQKLGPAALRGGGGEPVTAAGVF